MGRITLVKPRKHTSMAVTIAISVFSILYLGGALQDAKVRTASAMEISYNRAHTRVGKEGYEYIFDPDTHIFIDKILPNGNTIIINVVLIDYMPFKRIPECRFLEKDICSWMHQNILYFHDPTPTIRRLAIFSLVVALLVGVGFYLLRVYILN